MSIEGKAIQFRGKSINTHVQKGDNFCEKYATLYACQMAKTGRFHGYKQVNAAFAAGQLARFADFHTIPDSGRLKDAGNIVKERIHPFIKSWIYRSLHLPADRWQDLKVQDILKQGPRPSDINVFLFQAGEPVYGGSWTSHAM